MSLGNALPFERIILEFKDAPIFAQDKKSYIFSFQTKFERQIYFHKSIIPLRKTGDVSQDPLYTWLQEYGRSSEHRKIEMLEDQYEASGLYKHRPYKTPGTGEVKETDSLLIKTFRAVGSCDEEVIPGIEIRPTAFIANNSTQLLQPSPADIPSVLSQHHSSNIAESSESHAIRASRTRSQNMLDDDDDLPGGDSMDEALGDIAATDETVSTKQSVGRPSRKKATRRDHKTPTNGYSKTTEES
ncbi:hypothetical protein BGX26_006521 [Mortierella sp. AD094]|nr:hypothetical protein BGX26_006521 [Mortierella sp. AD094]